MGGNLNLFDVYEGKQKVTTLRVAANQRRGGKEETFWWRVTIWGEQFDKILVSLLKPADDRLWVNGASFADLMGFMELKFDLLLREQIINYLKINYLAVINQELSVILKDLKRQIPDILKIPEMSKSSIPLGIDDGQVYRLNEISKSSIPLGIDDGQVYRLIEINDRVEIELSLIANKFVSTDLRTVDRYYELVNKGFKSKRGILSFSRGKYFLYIPFTKKVSEERDGDVIASADLGLKTLATLSVYSKNREIDRQFLDQKYLGGKKDQWFLKPDKLNLKGKLMDRRMLARQNQSIRMSSDKGSMRHWFARDVEKTQWRKISNTHRELIRQISTRIISYLNYHNMGTLVLENLKWSTHSPKSKSGYFLATWQVHWFFSQVQSMLSNMAKLHGISVELVNPRNSSKICHRCGVFGKRAGKQFHCTNDACTLNHMDSDLNAARNLVKRSKRYRKLNNLISDAIG